MASVKPENNTDHRTDSVRRLKEMTPDLLSWFSVSMRPLPWRNPVVAYHTWISEIMLQQTRIDVVIDYYERFLKLFPDIPSLADAEEDQLLKAWEGLGYYSRVRNIGKTARILIEQYNGRLPGTKDELRTLPGIGDYTAAAIASITAGEPVAAVDGNVLRVCSRLLDDHRNVLDASTKRDVTSLLNHVIPAETPGMFNEAMMELGETVCLPGESCSCEFCPVRSHCLACERQTAVSLPVRIKKASKASEKMTVFILVTDDGKVAVRKRPEKGLLSGLFEFPNTTGHLSEKNALSYLKSQGFSVGLIKELEPHTHIFSHIRWYMNAYLAQVSASDMQKADKPFQFVRSEELFSVYPLPGAFSRFRDAVFVNGE